MNRIILVGNLIKDVELKTTSNSKVYTKNIICVDRNYKNSEGEKLKDFIPIAVWGKNAEILCKFAKKGSYLSLSGSLETRVYENDKGEKKYMSEIVVDEFRFINTLKASGSN